MHFLVWDNKADMQASLDAVNQLFGCFYQDGNYVMERWAEGTKHASQDLWGFSGFKDQHVGFSKQALMNVLIGEYQEVASRPQGWVIEESQA